MAGERIRLEVAERERKGTRESRRLRKRGLIPGVLYGRSQPHAISIPERDLRRVLTGDSGLHAILDVVLQGQKTTHPSILKEFQQDPVKGRLIHIDLQEVRLDQAITASVTVTLIGAEDAPGIREGGVVSQVNREVNVEALPMEIPEHLDFDISSMQIGDTLRLADLRTPEGVKLLDDPDTVLATLTMPTREVEPEEVPEGEQAPEGAAEAPAGGEAAGEPGTTEG